MTGTDFTPLHFIGAEISVAWDVPPAREKTPACPQAFTWDGSTYRIAALLAEWNDFTRHGRMARNMQPQHASRATIYGSLGVGRFFFRVKTESGQIFDLRYDRAIKSAIQRSGSWTLLQELEEIQTGSGSPTDQR